MAIAKNYTNRLRWRALAWFIAPVLLNGLFGARRDRLVGFGWASMIVVGAIVAKTSEEHQRDNREKERELEMGDAYFGNGEYDQGD